MQPIVKAVRKAIDADNKSGNFLTSGRLKDGSVFENGKMKSRDEPQVKGLWTYEPTGQAD